jgi:hypothetical protein
LLNATTQLPLLPATVKLILNCTAFTGSNLDVWLEHSFDGGTTYVLHSSFAQLTGTGGRTLDFKNYMLGGDAAAEGNSAQVTGANANNGPIMRNHRIAWSVGRSDQGAGTPTMTFSVHAAILPL